MCEFRVRRFDLKHALRELRAENEGVAVDSVPETEYDCREKNFKESATTGRSGRPAPRAILGWSSSTEMDDAAAALQSLASDFVAKESLCDRDPNEE